MTMSDFGSSASAIRGAVPIAIREHTMAVACKASHTSTSVPDPDFNVQRSTFGNGTAVTVNLGLLGQELPDGQAIPGQSVYIRHANGSLTRGRFQATLELDPARPDT